MPLMLCEVAKVPKVKELHPAVLNLGDAARYLGMARVRFSKLLEDKIIPWTTHIDGVQRIFIKSDLDEYLDSRPRSRGKLSAVENPPTSKERGEGTDGS